MAYDHDAIVWQVTKLLTAQPGRSLESIAAHLGIERHTITRALKDAGSGTFEAVQASAILAALDRVWAEGSLKSKKELAASLGLAPASLSRWITRHAKARNVRWHSHALRIDE